MTTTSTQLPFHQRLEIGLSHEQTFIDLIASMGGEALSIGPQPSPDYRDATKPVIATIGHDGEGTRYYIAPDVMLCFPDKPNLTAQVKHKHKPEGKGDDCFFYLDHVELHRMRRASFWKPIFVIHSPAVQEDMGSPFIWVPIYDLDEERNYLRKRTVGGTKTYCLPLSLFRSISELKEFTYAPHH